MKRQFDRTWLIAIVSIFAGLMIGFIVGSQLVPELMSAAVSDLNVDQQDEYVTLIALAYSQTNDLEEARRQLAELRTPNAGQYVASVAESQIARGDNPQTIRALAVLANALGVRNNSLTSYLATATPMSTSTPLPTATPTSTPIEPTATPEPPSPTPSPTSEPPTPTPELAPSVISESPVNVRSGPGVGFGVAGGLGAGEAAPIVGRTSDGSWWQIELTDGTLGWVLVEIVTTIGDTGGIAVASNIPTPPPAITRPPVAAAPPTATPAPKSTTPYTITNVRLRGPGEASQSCAGGDHYVWVTVMDAAGNPIDGVRVQDVWTQQVFVTGAQGKGQGRAEVLIWQDGGAELQVVDDGNNAISPRSPGMPSNLPPWELFQAAGYCGCKPYPDVDSCRAGWQARDFAYFPNSHYVYEITFQRTN
ncbi:MAG: SH3 domain-containing protein [Caldilineales bacterium]|nr:SH3 domain-containing protein [Caldilineales bacterium]